METSRHPQGVGGGAFLWLYGGVMNGQGSSRAFSGEGPGGVFARRAGVDDGVETTPQNQVVSGNKATI